MKLEYTPPEFIEFEGYIYLGRPESLARTIREYRERWPTRADWQLQSFFNHSHFSHRNGEEACLRAQFADAEDTQAQLISLFPQHTFVLLIEPSSMNTFYQAVEGAPTESEEHWEPNGPLSAGVLQELIRSGIAPEEARAQAFEAYREVTCERCKAKWRYELDYLRTEFPGTRWADCPYCELPNLVATRLLRWVSGPDGVNI